MGIRGIQGIRFESVASIIRTALTHDALARAHVAGPPPFLAIAARGSGLGFACSDFKHLTKMALGEPSSAGASASWLIALLACLTRRSQPSWPSSDHMASHKETQSGCGARKGHGHDRGHARRSARRHGLPRGRWAIDSPWHRRPSGGRSWWARRAARANVFCFLRLTKRSNSPDDRSH